LSFFTDLLLFLLVVEITDVIFEIEQAFVADFESSSGLFGELKWAKV
jgi:hypothetical protein